MKIALITGASRGLGKSSAIEIAKRGVGVIVTYNSHPDGANEVVRQIEAEGGKAAALALDVTRIDTFENFVQQVTQVLESKWNTNRINFLMNNAGSGGYNRIENVSEVEFDLMMNVHLKGPFFLTQKLLPLIAEGGHILNVTSATSRVAFEGCAPYASMKGGLDVLTRYMAKEFGQRKIRVNSIAPGAIRTDLGGGLDNAPDFVKLLTDMTALSRIGDPIDVGLAVASLFSDDSQWINGQRIEISGGMNL